MPETKGKRVQLCGRITHWVGQRLRLTVSRLSLGARLLSSVALLSLATNTALAQAGNQLLDDGIGQKRVALIIGNSEYSSLPRLLNPTNDVAAVADVLRKADFDVLVGEDLTKLEVEDYVRQFLRASDGADVSLFYYSGHGIGMAGQNFLAPVDADLTSPYDVELQMTNLDIIMNYMRTHSKTQLVFLDACRDNPFQLDAYWKADQLEAAPTAGGLSQMSTGLGSLIAFATAPGQVAFDGEGDKSPFTGAFVNRALTPNLEIRSLLTEVRRDVITVTDGQQVPWENSSLVDNFFFVKRDSRPVVAPMLTIRAAADEDIVTLNIPAPRQPEGGSVNVTLEQLPVSGVVRLDNEIVNPGSVLPADDLTRLTFVPDQGTDGQPGLIVYKATNEWRQDVRGVVAITVDSATAEERAQLIAERQEKQQRIQLALADSASLFRGAIDGQSREVEIGLGPIDLNLGFDIPEASAERSWIKVTALPRSGVLRVGERALTLGERLRPAELSTLTFEPQIGSQEQVLEAFFEFEPAEGGSLETAQFTLSPMLNACDDLAGEPLDLQGVAPGRLPNEIPVEAISVCEQALEMHPDTVRFQHQLGRALLADRQVDAANQAFRKAADEGHMRAIYQIGYMHAVGAGFEKNRKTANGYYRRSSDLGDPYGMTVWGRSLYHGRDVDVDQRLGLELMLAAADQGHTYAMNDLGGIFLFGIGRDADPERGLRFLRAGAERDDIYSLNLLGLSYMRGQGVDADPSRAIEYFTLASDGGHPNAPTNVGRMYRDGFGVSRDLGKAIEFLELGAARGDGYGAFDRAVLAMQADERSVAARYFATASAVGRDDGLIRDGYANLDVIDIGDREAALATLRNELDGAERPANKGSLNDNLVAMARAVWEKNNPRFDLF